MNLWQFPGGQITVTLTSADPQGALGALNETGVVLHRVECVEPLTVRFRCDRRCRGIIRTLARKRGEQAEFSSEAGFVPAARRLLARPVLLAGLSLFFCLTLVLPTRVLFFRVEGNSTVPSRKILEAAADCGIGFGASRKEVRSEKMKNALLMAMPELKWAGINTSGCTAVISVRERAMEEEPVVIQGIGSIAAVRDAYVTEITVTRGSALCSPGEAVREGQILISGYTDLGLCLQVTQAQGEVYGQTRREERAVSPVNRLFRRESGDTITRYSLIFGKKRINFWKGSGISPATCGRMYQEYCLTLPGGFQLPVRLGIERLTDWETEPGPGEAEPLEAAMLEDCRSRTLAQTIAGEILSQETEFSQEDGVFRLTCSFRCREMIGRITKEQIGEANGKTD